MDSKEPQLKINQKVFVIGFNKTASTSLHYLFMSLKLKSYHGPKWRKHNDIELLQKYDCFSDGTPRDLAELDRSFPGSRYILNVRDLEGWIYSRLAHIERRKEKGIPTRSPTWDNTEYAIKHWIQTRNNYHLFVLSYFSNRPEDILVVNFIRDDAASKKVCQFLGYEGNHQREKRNVNPTKERPQKHVDMFNRCIAELELPKQELSFDIYCPSLVRSEELLQHLPDSAMRKGT
jgi:hypothetical protein